MADLNRKININDALNLADELKNRKKYELAEKLYLKIINYDKFNIRATNNLANIYKNQGKTDLAFKIVDFISEEYFKKSSFQRKNA